MLLWPSMKETGKTPHLGLQRARKRYALFLRILQYAFKPDITAHRTHPMRCEASYVFGTGNEDNLSPKSSIKRKHHAHCRCIATSSFHNRPITYIYVCVARNAPGSPFRCGVLYIRLFPYATSHSELSAFYHYSQNWKMALDNYQI